MTHKTLPRFDRNVRLDDVSFPDKLLEALGPREVRAPELNPVPRAETVRFVNGLPRRTRPPVWFAPPPPIDRREAFVDTFLAQADRSGASEPVQRLIALLEERRAARRELSATLLQIGLSTREI